MLQYASHLDQYGGRTLIQDSINQIGPYVLDRKKDPNNKLFLRQSFERPINKEVRILDEFPGNKVAFFPSYHCVGNPTEVINELKQNKYKFRNWNLTQILESILDKL